MIQRMLGLGWQYRMLCLGVLTLQLLRVLVGLVTLGWIGLSVDFLRHESDPSAVTPRWPFGFIPPDTWGSMSILLLLAGSIAVTSLLHAALRHRAEMIAATLVERMVIDLRTRVYNKLQKLSFSFFDSNESGSIINRVAGDVQSVRMFVDGVIVQIVVVFLSLALYLGYMLRIHPGLTLACLGTTPALWIGAVRFSRIVRPDYVHNRSLMDRLILTLSESVQGISVVKGFHREEFQIDRFARSNRDVRDHKHRIFWTLSLFQPGMFFLTHVNLMVLLAYGGNLVIEGELRLGEGLFVFAGLLQQFASQVDQVTNITNRIQASLTGAERVFGILDAPILVESRPDTERRSKMAGRLQFENVSFGYNSGESVLQEISFEVEPGSMVAILGETGSGKTTLLRLVPRFYDVQSGRILIDGVDVRDWHLEDLRKNIGYVFQEPFLFSHTIAANVGFGRPGVDEPMMWKAIAASSSREFVSEFPNQLQTVIGEYGANLSGGQRQRLSLARALLLEPAILVLDDATASVDSETEQEILFALENLPAKHTTLIVTHRLAVLRRANLILVLDEGNVVQRGTHEELISQPGHYRDSVLVQGRRSFNSSEGAGGSQAIGNIQGVVA